MTTAITADGVDTPKVVYPDSSEQERKSILVQYASAFNNVRTTVTAVIPFDNSTPQISEGVEVATLTITPKKIGNKIKIAGVVPVAHATVGNGFCIAIFNGSVDSIAAVIWNEWAANNVNNIPLFCEDTISNLDPITYSIRAGVNTGTGYLNGNSSPYMGGVLRSSLIVEEIEQ